MIDNFDFQDLFVLDLANNHQGDVDHALRIIRECGAVVRRQGVRAAFKFQFRDLDTLVHPTHRHGSANKHIPRFLSTRLTRDQFQVLFDAVRGEGMLTMCTPFDEPSVELIAAMGFDVVKVASCSAKDWPLLQKVASINRPVIFSTGGLQLSNIDDLVSFFDHRGTDYAIMHCVSIYPIPPDQFNLQQIEVLRERYRNRVIGWSTHEPPDATAPVQVAVAKGARMFERHVGIGTETVALNAYSSTPAQLDAWMTAYKAAVTMCGTMERRISPVEQESLDSLRRGVYARVPITKGERIDSGEVYFAMPYLIGQIESGAWRAGATALADLAADAPLLYGAVTMAEDPNDRIIKEAIHEVKALLNESRIALNTEFQVDYSHHYGVANFRKYGAVIINVINREYCKKIIVQLPGQKHPAHFHKRKEETFQLLYGDLTVSLEGKIRTLSVGETLLVMPGVWHSFWTEHGCVFEEVSTTHFNNDSVYKDDAINKMERHERKTVVDHWGRYQLPERIEHRRV